MNNNHLGDFLRHLEDRNPPLWAKALAYGIVYGYITFLAGIAYLIFCYLRNHWS